MLGAEGTFTTAAVTLPLHTTKMIPRRYHHAADSLCLAEVTLNKIEPGLGVVPVPITAQESPQLRVVAATELDAVNARLNPLDCPVFRHQLLAPVR